MEHYVRALYSAVLYRGLDGEHVYLDSISHASIRLSLNLWVALMEAGGTVRQPSSFKAPQSAAAFTFPSSSWTLLPSTVTCLRSCCCRCWYSFRSQIGTCTPSTQLYEYYERPAWKTPSLGRPTFRRSNPTNIGRATANGVQEGQWSACRGRCGY